VGSCNGEHASVRKRGLRKGGCEFGKDKYFKESFSAFM